MILGLQYGTVKLAAHSASWEAAYLSEHSRLREALSAIPCRIEHVGSTAVPGLPAKPIIDIAVGLSSGCPIAPLVAILQGIGYVYRGDAKQAGGHIFVRESTPLVRTHHVHLVYTADPQWEEYLVFRDLLRQNPEARAAYAAEKQALALRYPMDRRSYSRGKDRIVRRLLDQRRSMSG